MKISHLARFIAVLFFLLTTETAICADEIPGAEMFFKDPDIRLTELSPLGHYVAILSTVDGYQVLSVRDTSDLTKMNVVTSTNVNKIYTIEWVNENRLVFQMKNTNQTFDIGNVDTYAVDRDGSNLTELISGSWDHHQKNTGSNIVDKTLTAEYGLYGATHNNSDDIIVKKYVFNNLDSTSHVTHLFRLNSRNKKLSEIVDGNQPADVFAWLLDTSDIPRIAISAKAGICTMRYHARNSDTWTELEKYDCLEKTGKEFTPEFFDSQETMFVSKSFQEAGKDASSYSALYQYDLNKKTLGAEPFVAIHGFDFDGNPVLQSDTNKLLGIHYATDAIATIWLDPHMKQLQALVDKKLPQTTNTISCGTDCLHSPALLISSSSDRQPTQYFVYHIERDKLLGIGGTYPEIKAKQMGLRDFYHYTARDGMSIPVYVTVPPGKASGPMPTVVLVHGGPFVRGASWEWDKEAQFLASRGYVVIQPEFRGSEGFGFDHFHAGWKQWGQAMQDDLADAALWSVQKGWSDPKRIGIMGASYGGYATLMGLIKNPELFRCGVEWAGVTDLNMMFDLSQSDATQENLHYSMRTLVGDQKADAEMFKKYSPLNHAEQLTQPLLMAHGGLDRRVPIAQASAFHDAVVKTNKNVEWVVYTDEGHGFFEEDNNLDFWIRVEKFLDKNLKNAN